jgi:filamentous hemagglutinin
MAAAESAVVVAQGAAGELGAAPDVVGAIKSSIKNALGNWEFDSSLGLRSAYGPAAEGGLGGAAPGSPAETPLDWSLVSKVGDSREAHVTLHGSNDLQKATHGVFYGDPVSTVNDAWSLAQKTGVQPVTIGGTDLHLIPRPNSGWAGGFLGQGQNLDAVTIVTKTGTNKLITGFPGNGLPTPKP